MSTVEIPLHADAEDISLRCGTAHTWSVDDGGSIERHHGVRLEWKTPPRGSSGRR